MASALFTVQPLEPELLPCMAVNLGKSELNQDLSATSAFLLGFKQTELLNSSVEFTIRGSMSYVATENMPDKEFLIKHFYPHSSKVQNVSPERVNEQAVVRYLAQGQSAEPLQMRAARIVLPRFQAMNGIRSPFSEVEACVCIVFEDKLDSRLMYLKRNTSLFNHNFDKQWTELHRKPSEFQYFMSEEVAIVPSGFAICAKCEGKHQEETLQLNQVRKLTFV
ncbi:hypothetical protein F2P81_005553 [Scophthalmus maximus]|uniref:Uncharacterized protein n=1 Tax=Scophthalmus maximus TaxID=52904 RepID=A0A6A4TGN1_SCOMX|nr:hypothetical protein F2P81_005553 [Scophthalmus maximus]